MSKYFFILFLSLPFLLTSCCSDHAGYGYDTDVSNNLPELVWRATDTIPQNRLSAYSHIYCDSQGREKVVSCDTSHVIIEEYVHEITGNDTIVLVDQKPYDKILEECDGELWNPSLRKKALKESSLHEYWIIMAKDFHVYGPLSEQQYYKYREKLNVPDNLRLSFEKGKFAEFLLDVQSFAFKSVWYIIGFAFWALLIWIIIKLCCLIKKVCRRI